MRVISHYPCLPQAGPKALKGRSLPGSLSSEDSNQPKILDEVRQYLRLHHYSIHTERSYVDWIIRFIRFHRMRSREDLLPGEPKIEAFLTHLAVEGNVATATQNQAMNALVFLYKRVLRQAMEAPINAVRADKKAHVPVVMTREEVASVISLLVGTPQLVVKLLYGSGLRIMEAVRVRVQDIDFQMKQLTVRAGKGGKDRITTFPGSLTPLLQTHLARTKTLHQQDLARDAGEVFLPHALPENSRTPVRNGAGSMCSRRVISQPTPAAAPSAGIMSTPA
jgi:site-specific recombinase XerD